MKPKSYGYYAWSPHSRNTFLPENFLAQKYSKAIGKVDNTDEVVPSIPSCKNRITIENVVRCLLLDRIPPKLRDIDKTKSLINQRCLPNELRDTPRQSISLMRRPFATTKAFSLYVAQQRGCNLKNIDFLLSGSILGILHKRFIEQHTILIHVRRGIIIVEKLKTANLNFNAAGFKFERLICDEKYQQRSNLIENECVREINLGNHRVLISAEVDCVDNKGNPIESKFLKEKLFNKEHEMERNRKLLFQMLSQGAAEVVIGTKKFHKTHGYSEIVDIQSHSIDYLLENSLNHFSVDDIIQPLIEGLNDLKDLVRSGAIRSEENYYYKLTFEQPKTGVGKRIMVVEPLNMSETVVDCSEYLYDVLISDTNKYWSLMDIQQQTYGCSNLTPHYKSCNCNKRKRQIIPTRETSKFIKVE